MLCRIDELCNSGAISTTERKRLFNALYDRARTLIDIVEDKQLNSSVRTEFETELTFYRGFIGFVTYEDLIKRNKEINNG